VGLKTEDLSPVAAGEVQISFTPPTPTDGDGGGGEGGDDGASYKWMLYRQGEADHYLLAVYGLGKYLWVDLWRLITELSGKFMGFSDPEVCIISPLSYEALLLVIHSKGAGHLRWSK
jgi:hypothetical protein